MKNIFDSIYEGNKWGNSESRSGDGSDIFSTAHMRGYLATLLKDLKIKSILDLPCGDFNWMQLMNLKKIDYIGGDIVASMIEENQLRYGSENIRFQHIDARKDSLPTVDLIFCRDMLVHLSFSDCWSVLTNFQNSESTYLLTTTFTARDPNYDIKTGQWRPLNLQRPPFIFTKPSHLIVEHCNEWNGFWADKCLALWSLKDIDIAMQS